jgi:ankyrin repeat protein
MSTAGSILSSLSVASSVIEKNNAALMAACLSNRTDYKFHDVRELIDRGADVNMKDEDGLTPLHRAVMGNSLKTAALLIDRGAVVDALTNVSSLIVL